MLITPQLITITLTTRRRACSAQEAFPVFAVGATKAVLLSNLCTPPTPLHSIRGDEGTVTFPFSNLCRRLDIELLRCVCWLAKVVLLVHWCAHQGSSIQGTPLYPVSCRTLQFFVISVMD